MVRKTKEEARETRGRILKSAVNVFYEKGVGNATLENIAHAAGLTRGAIYWHFENKLDLLSGLHEQMHDGFMQQLLESRNKATATPLHELSELIIQTLVQLEDDEDYRKTLAIFITKSDDTGDMAAFLEIEKQKKKECLDVVKDFFDQAKNRGQLPPEADCNLLSMMLWFFVSGIMHEYLRDRSAVVLTTQARPLVERFFKGIF